MHFYFALYSSRRFDQKFDPAAEKIAPKQDFFGVYITEPHLIG